MTTMPPLLGFVGFSGVGKTTLLVKLLPVLRGRGLRVGVLKHAHHDFEIDTPGKDSYELRKAGASEMLVASAQRWALLVDNNTDAEPQLEALLKRMDLARLDLILVEGFKHESIPKIELHRAALGHPLLHPDDSAIIALATDSSNATPCPVAMLDINNVTQIADFVCARLNTSNQTAQGENS